MTIEKCTVEELYTYYLKIGFIHKQHKLTENPSKNLYNGNIIERSEGTTFFFGELMKDHGISVLGRVASHYDLIAILWNREVVCNDFKRSMFESRI
uniref:Uncharacterized protein n=1 Tax=Lepeophtheirus salmonis TaxID=72036 RepID=A0A0K2V8D2_LEPSM